MLYTVWSVLKIDEPNAEEMVTSEWKNVVHIGGGGGGGGGGVKLH